MTRLNRHNEAAKQRAAIARGAIAAYFVKYGGDEVDLVNLAGFVRHHTGHRFHGSALALRLTEMGYRRDGVRPIDTCPGRATFYVKEAGR